MPNNISAAVNVLDKKNKFNESYNNLANSAVNTQRIKLLEDRARGKKVASGLITGAGEKVIAKDIITTDTGEQQVLSAIQNLMARYPEYKSCLDDIKKKKSSAITSDNITEYRFRQINTDDEIPAPTYVSSDPVKPDNVTQQDNSNVIKNQFNINDLYHDVDNISLYDNIYTDVNTKRLITSDNVISYSDDGTIIRTSVGSESRLPTYRLIPNTQMEQTTVTDATPSDSVTKYMFRDQTVDQSNLHDRTLSSEVISSKQVKYKYLFCLDGVSVEHRSITNTAGYISAPFSTVSGTYIEIEVDTAQGVEYSVIDGEDEIPILPKNVTEIIDEKLFFGMMPRFTIMNPEDITVKRNGILTGITTQRDLELFLTVNTKNSQTGESSYNNSDVYTVTYKPEESARRYFPKTDTLRIKVIQRVLLKQTPKTIGNVKILQYNTPASWYLRSWDQDSEYNPTDPRYRMVRTWNT